MYITENAEKNKFLKNTIRRFDRLRSMFCNYFDQNKDMRVYLQELINNAQPEQGQDERFGMMYHRLVNDKRSIAYLIGLLKKKLQKMFSEYLHAINSVSASLIKGGTKSAHPIFSVGRVIPRRLLHDT